mmetsp:Transcript_37035/g.69055  ORF Transcript_37035/g.69055 Transcript_37035/m.69055 type:complete len:286 (+) Transcript_37035:338-1195(+)
MPSCCRSRNVVVDPRSVELKVRVDSEGRLHGTAGHDHLLNRLLTRGSLSLALVVVLVLLEVIVGCLGRSVALGRASRRLLGWAAGFAFRRIRILTLRSVMVAVRQREVAAQARSEGAGSLVLAAADGARLLDVLPRRVDHATITAIRIGVKANILSRNWDHRLALCRNAHTIGGCLCPSECPAAAAIRLVANVVDDLLAIRPLLSRVEGLRDLVVVFHEEETLNLTTLDGGSDRLRHVAFDTAKALGGSRCFLSKTLHSSWCPRQTWRVSDLLDHHRALRMHLHG